MVYLSFHPDIWIEAVLNSKLNKNKSILTISAEKNHEFFDCPIKKSKIKYENNGNGVE